MGNELRIGWSEVDITPENCVVELSGQYYQRVSEGDSFEDQGSNFGVEFWRYPVCQCMH